MNERFGTHYFWVKDRLNGGVNVWLGVNSDGISVCDQHDKTAVIVTYYWTGYFQITFITY